MGEVRPRTTLDEVNEKGGLVRTAAGFNHKIEKGGQFEPEKDRYHLYISYACPWANRCLAVRNMKGLEDTIGLSVVHPTWQRTRPEKDEHCGWVFRQEGDAPVSSSSGFGSFDCGGCVPDTVNDASTVRELYEKANDQTGKYSVPVLWDKKTGTIVNNESEQIVRILNTAFNEEDLCRHPNLDLYPTDMREQIEEVNKWVYHSINNGVYRCGFAKSQEAYEQAVDELFAAIDRCEEILSRQRYIAGDHITEADVRLFMTLVRFDEVYIVYFKTNCKAIREYPNLLNYCREMYQVPGMVVNMRHIKVHYFTSHPTLNAYGIVPKGSNTEQLLSMPHDRDRKYN